MSFTVAQHPLFAHTPEKCAVPFCKKFESFSGFLGIDQDEADLFV